MIIYVIRQNEFLSQDDVWEVVGLYKYRNVAQGDLAVMANRDRGMYVYRMEEFILNEDTGTTDEVTVEQTE